ncbi:ABC transporter permease [Phytoactinopolyspora mesophila]|uniref:ABC transporter permease subunit n=1 Tax=Phytoactinopolyspora mesophila TaxID=2650750 RepID=A0A7K3M1R3_9ACTN|nr:ABC transporter permease [Phytoactinopolyspora mesophila]NDL57233.1 ABC transporter permease subunit [Phytoactinopolyspora mesophila]
MTFLEYLSRRWEHLFELTVDHAAVTLLSVGISALIGVTLGLAVYRTDRPREIVIAITAIFLTIPSLALFGLFMPIFGLGWTSVVIALVMYGLLPIVRNTVVGLREVDSAIVESAQGMGMSRTRRLLRIELPLAWPVIMTGIRVSTVIIVGIAAIGAYINGPGLGNDIFRALANIGSPQALNITLGAFFCIIVLAILFDLFYVLVTRLTMSRGLR